MFNTTHIHNSSTKLVPYERTVTINEHRAPTDKSVKLLNEMQQQAKDNIIETVVIDQNFLKGLIIFFRNEIVTSKITYGLKFILNGEEYTLKGDIDQQDYPYIGTDDIQTQFLIIRDFFIPLFSETIAKELIKQLPSNLLQSKSK